MITIIESKIHMTLLFCMDTHLKELKIIFIIELYSILTYDLLLVALATADLTLTLDVLFDSAIVSLISQMHTYQY
jgi:hypothetical protein